MVVRRAQELTLVIDDPAVACAQASSYRGAGAARLSLAASPVVGVLEIVLDEEMLEALDGDAG